MEFEQPKARAVRAEPVSGRAAVVPPPQQVLGLPRRPARWSGRDFARVPVHGVRQQVGEGAPLPTALRAEAEARFESSFERVRVHDSPGAHALAQSGLARVVTIGPDIVFGAGQYRSGSHDARELLGHELAHIVQQGRFGGAGPAVPAHEAAAEASGRAFATGSGPIVAGPSAIEGAQCAPLPPDEIDTLKRKARRATAGKGSSAPKSSTSAGNASSASKSSTSTAGKVPSASKPSTSTGKVPSASRPSAPTAEIDVPLHRLFRRFGAPAPAEHVQQHGTTPPDRAWAQYYGKKYGPPGHEWTAGHEKPASQTPPGERPSLRVQAEGENKAGGTAVSKENELRRLDPTHRDPNSPHYTRPTKPRYGSKAYKAQQAQKAAAANKPGVPESPDVAVHGEPAAPVASPQVKPGAPPSAEVEPTSAVTPEGGGLKVMGSQVAGAVVPLVLGAIHQHALPARLAEVANEKGFASAGSVTGPWYDRFLDRAGEVLYDPTLEGERSVSLRSRLNVPVWRSKVRDYFAGHKVGDQVKFTWEGGESSSDTKLTYTLGPDGRWIESEHHPDIIDINTVLSPNVSSEAIMDWLSPSPSMCLDVDGEEVPCI